MISTTLPRSERAGLPVIEAGHAHPILLLHGVGLCAEVWGPQIQTLSTTYHVLAPDMPGHGQTPLDGACETLRDYVDAVRPLLNALGEPALVVGHSMGAMIALELAATMPARVCGVAALNAIYRRSDAAKVAVRARADGLDGQSIPDPTPTLARWFGADASPERAACDHWLRAVDPMGYKRAYTVFAQSDGPSRSTLSVIPCPALFATGAAEPNSTPAMSRAMADLAPRGRAEIIADAAHMMPLTHAPDVNRLLLALGREVWS